MSLVHLQSADELAAESPDVVAVSLVDEARQRLGQQLAQERLEAFHHARAGRHGVHHTPGCPAIDRDPDSSSAGIGGGLLCWQAVTPPGSSRGCCCHAADLPAERAAIKAKQAACAERERLHQLGWCYD
jgi:hypothetical protein